MLPAGSQIEGAAARNYNMWGHGKTSLGQGKPSQTLGKTPFRQHSANQGPLGKGNY